MLHGPVIFIGDKPSYKNKDNSTAFVGTISYKRLLEWIYEMDLDISNIVTYNKDKTPWIAWSPRSPHISQGAKIIVLGKEAKKEAEKYELDFFEMPHPSGLNRKLNDKKWLKKQLKACENYIKEIY